MYVRAVNGWMKLSRCGRADHYRSRRSMTKSARTIGTIFRALVSNRLKLVGSRHMPGMNDYIMYGLSRCSDARTRTAAPRSRLDPADTTWGYWSLLSRVMSQTCSRFELLDIDSRRHLPSSITIGT